MQDGRHPGDVVVMEMKRALWHRHRHVRSGDQLTSGERAADVLKRWFGSWAFLVGLNVVFFSWVAVDFATGQKIDPGLFYANLFLSWLAGQQGGALQIAANRGDRISSEVAMSTLRNGEELLRLNEQQLTILTELRALRDAIDQAD